MKRGLVLGLIIVLAACGGRNDKTELLLTGTVESDPVRIASLVGGRLLEVNAVEGDAVKAGRLIARIDSADLELQLKQAETAVRAAETQLALVRKGVRSEDLATAREQVNQAEIAVDKAERERKRLARLYEEGAIPAKALDDATDAAEQTRSVLEQAKKQYEKAQTGARKEEIEAAEALRDQARAAADILRKKIGDCLILSPSDGTVLHRLAEPGEVVAAGTAIATIADLATVKITAYVSERELGSVALGKDASLRADAFPGKSFPAKVSLVADEAEFTPKTIQTREERVKTVFRVELTAANPDGIFKPGMPVDVSIVRTIPPR